MRPPLFSSTLSATETSKKVLSMEEMLGADWLNKLGVIILVIGVALFLAYQLKTLGPAGKVLVGYVVGAALLGAGLLFEKRAAYRVLSRAGIGGGWALVYFTTYAMHHVEAARIISSQAVDLVLLLIVAAAMVAHTLRYETQVVTGLAFLLGFATVTISHVNVYSLLASAILAVALVVIVQTRGWFELEIFGILATYLNHWYWLRPIIEPMGKHHHPFAEFPASAGLLVFYWAVFRASYVRRRIAGAYQENISTVAALLNTFLLLGVMKYQAIHPEWAFWFLLLLGVVELALGQLPLARHRRAAFVILSTLGVGLLVAAFPFRYSGYRLSILWLAESQTLFLAGVLTREILFRRLGMLASVVVAGQMLSVDAANVFGARMDNAHPVSEWRLGVIFGFATALFYGSAHWVHRRWRELITTEFEELCFSRLSYLAGVMALVGAWLTWPRAWTAVAWSAIALVLAVVGNRLVGARHGVPVRRELLAQAHVLAAAALLRVFVVNLYDVETYHHLTLRSISVSLVAVLLYLCSRWTGVQDWVATRRLPAVYSWAASTLVALLVWYELRPASVALGWTLFGLVLFEYGITRGWFWLRLEGYVALASAFLRLFFVNLNASGSPGELSPRVYTVFPIVLAFYYVYARLDGNGEFASDRRVKAQDLSGYFGTIALAALARFELGPDWVIVAWAALTLALAALAYRAKRPVFLHQSYLIAFAVLFRALFHNFYERSYFAADFWHSRWWSVGSTVAILFLVLPVAFKFRHARGNAHEASHSRESGNPPEPSHPREGGNPPQTRHSRESGNPLARVVAVLDRHPEQLFFFIPIFLLTVLLAMEMRSGMVTVSWGVEAVAVFVFALWVGQRSFRLTGLGLLLLCVGKIIAVDIWGLTPRDRYLTFIVLGPLLLFVSYLYTRYKETLRQYL
ncbi:conserved membrane hypothetical protein [Acidobacteriia bacterium SbA2]|nr:conserved membrane hypothetical protein [Acidobacteriia bacterium SbA2]